MKREFLKELGLEDEVIDKVMAEHGKTIQSVKPADYDDLKTEKANLEQELTKLQDTLNNQEKELNSIEDLKKENETLKLEKIKINIASQANIPLELAGRLSGSNEEEIKADAEKIAGFVNKKQPLPLKPSEQDVNNEKREMEQMLDELTGKH